MGDTQSSTRALGSEPDPAAGGSCLRRTRWRHQGRWELVTQMRNREVPPKAGGTSSVRVLGEARRPARPGLVHEARDTAEPALCAERGRHPSRSRARRAFPQRDRRSHCHSQPSLCSRSAEFQRTRDERKRLGKKRKIDPLSSLSRQERCGPSRHPAKDRPGNGPVRMETGVTRHTEVTQSWGAPDGPGGKQTHTGRRRRPPRHPASEASAGQSLTSWQRQCGNGAGRGRRGQVSTSARCCPWCGAGQSRVQAAPERAPWEDDKGQQVQQGTE